MSSSTTRSIADEGYKSLKEGELVSYDIIEGDKGPQADQVMKLNARATAVAGMPDQSAPTQPSA